MKRTSIQYNTGRVYCHIGKWRVEVNHGSYRPGFKQPGWLSARFFESEEEATALLEKISPLLEEQARLRAEASTLDNQIVEAVNSAGKMIP